MAEQLHDTIIAGRYRLRSVLGRGAMGEVYRAEQLDIEGQVLREVALKMIRPEHVSDPTFARRFLREVRVATRLRSPHTVTVYEVGQGEDGQLFFSMELITGPTLRELLNTHGSLALERAIPIIQQICLALSEAHGLPEPIIHRDLKPPNIFVEQQHGHDWVKVGDFGIAKVLSEHTSGLTQAGMSPGTPRYMAPEQWRDEALDGRADLYAVGIILYEMLLGQPPFRADGGPTSLMYKHLEEPPPTLPALVPAGIRRVVEQLLAKEPDQRLPDALSVSAALASSLALPPQPDDQSTVVIVPRRDKPPSNPIIEQNKQDEPPEPKKDLPSQPAAVAEPRRKEKRFPLLAVGLVGLVFLLGSMWYMLVPPEQETTMGSSEKAAPQAGRQSPAQEQEAPESAEESRQVQEQQEAEQETQQQQYTNMVQIPAGTFWMGCKSDVDNSCFDNEKPGREVYVDAFWIDTYEVSVADYRQCVGAGECSDQNLTRYESCNWNKSDRADHPINCVDWNQARSYCHWAEKRLPTEAEWEKAARSDDGRTYPWGNDWDASKANTYEGNLGRTASVGSYPSGVSPYEVYEMAGNVWEWTQDWYAADYYQQGPAQHPRGPATGDYRSVRGGSSRFDQRLARVAFRYRFPPGGGDFNFGFRCASS